MFTQAPEITIDATVGQVVVQSTATPTSTPVATSTSQPSGSTATSTPSTSTSTKRYKQQALTIYGYGPINSEVSLKGFGVSEKVVSDADGLFRFTEIYSLSYTYPELCIQAIDDKKRTTQPSCIPALPSNSLIPLEVGPVLLSPTISISENKVKEGGIAVLSGKTTPNTKVNIFISKRTTAANKLSLVKEANAYSLPIVDTKSNEKGEYELSLPTGESADFKMFASTKYGLDNSAKSNTLTFSVLTELKTFLQELIAFIMQNKLIAFIIAEVVVFVLLFMQALKSTTKRKKRHNEKDYLEELKIYI
ncbi:MAG: hypothetical protein WA152_00650 [Microgenomates group bacterium]